MKRVLILMGLVAALMLSTITVANATTQEDATRATVVWERPDADTMWGDGQQARRGGVQRR